MTVRLYLEDAYMLSCSAVVSGMTSGHVGFDRTCFYPGGGGQPPDSGYLYRDDGSALRVASCRSQDLAGPVWHEVEAGAVPWRIGERCRLEVDRGRRVALMRFHTALHVLNAVVMNHYRGLITGVGMGVQRSHIDFALNYDTTMRSEIEGEANRVMAARQVLSARYITRDEFDRRPELRRTMEAAPPVDAGHVRVVRIGDFDEQACGGTHVRNTGEVGKVRIVKVDNKGRNNRRFYVELTE